MIRKRFLHRWSVWVLLGSAVIVGAVMWAAARKPQAVMTPTSLVRSPPPDSRPRERDAEAPAGASNTLFSDEVQANMALPTAPLPPLDMPLSAALNELEQRASEGDRSAACRLALETEICASTQQSQIDFDRWLAQRQQVLSKPLGDNAENVRRSFEEDLRLHEVNLRWPVEHCADLRASDARIQVAAWRRAAKLGSAQALRYYASGSVFEQSSVLANLDQLSTYRAEAEQMSLTVASWGDAPMSFLLADAYSPYPQSHTQRSLLSQVIRPNAAMALALLKRLQRDMRSISRDTAAYGAAASIRIRSEEEVRFLESRMSDSERARAAEVMALLDTQWAPANGGLAGITPDDLYLGAGLPRPRRAACGPSRDK